MYEQYQLIMAYGKRSRTRSRAPSRKKLKALVRRKAPKRKRAPAAGVKLSRPMRALVDKRIDRHLEETSVRYFLKPLDTSGGFPTSNFESAYTLRSEISGLNIFSLLPAIVQRVPGQASNELQNFPRRSGGEIRPKFLQVKIRLWTNPDVALFGSQANRFRELQVYAMIGHSKEFRNVPALKTNQLAMEKSFWWRPTNPLGAQNLTPTQEDLAITMSATNFDGSESGRLLGQLNTQRFTATHTWQPQINDGVAYGVDPDDPLALAGSVMVKTRFYQKTFNIPVPKTMKYEASSDVYPKAFAPFLAIGFNPMNGRSAAGNNTDNLCMTASCKFTYTDAG